MATINTEATGSRKKYLVPVVVLMLCAVALTGAGYAYTSTINSGSENIAVESFEITLGKSERITSNNMTGTLQFNSVVSKGAVAYTFVDNKDIGVFEVKIVNQNGEAKPVLKISNLAITTENTGLTVAVKDVTPADGVYTISEPTGGVYTVTLQFGYADEATSLTAKPPANVVVSMNLVAEVAPATA